MADKKRTRRLIVRELRRIHQGRTTKGAEYTIWQVVATSPDGREIEQTLRTFEELPKNQVIEVTVEKHASPEYGVSFTLAQVGKASADDRIKLLEERVARLEQFLYGSGDASAAPPQPAQRSLAPPPPPTPAPPAVPPAAPPVQRPPAPDEIPF